MRLLFITQDFPPGIGGIQTYSSMHAERINRFCSDFHLVCPEANPSDKEAAVKYDRGYSFDITRIGIRDSLLVFSLRKELPKLCSAGRFDATFHAQWQTAWPAIKARERGEVDRVFVAAHARELLYNPYKYLPGPGNLYNGLRRKVFQEVDHFFPVSRYTARLLQDQGVASERMTVIKNGTEPERFRPMQVDQLKCDLGLENATHVLLTVTRLVKRKGVDTVIRAVAGVAESFPGLHLLVAGTGPEEKRLKNLADRMGLRSQIHFLGSVNYEDLPRYYNLADLFLLASNTRLPDVEGFGIVFLEANACEVPVIGTDSGGVPCAIVDGKTGLIVKENRPDEMEQAIRRLIEQPKIAETMGMRGRKRVLEELNWDRVSERLYGKMEELMPEGRVKSNNSRKVVMVAPYFPPRRRVASQRPFRFAIHLKKMGWEPHIITIRSSDCLTTLEKRLLEGVRIHEIEPGFDRTESKSNDGTDTAGISNSRLKKILARITDSAASIVDRHFPMDTWLVLFRKELRNIRQTVSGIGPDIIWSTGDPWSGHWLASRLAANYAIPWVADFRDPWTVGGMELRSRSRFSSWLDKRYERSTLMQADFVTFTSERTESLYRSAFPFLEGKTETLPNSFEVGLYRDEQNEERVSFDESSLNLVFFGKFRTLSPVQPVLDLLNRVKTIDRLSLHRIRIYSFGEPEERQMEKIRKQGLEDHFLFADPIPPESGPSTLKRADLMLISTHPVRENIIPAKLWDYLAAGMPILSIAPNPEIGQVLRKTGLGVQYPADRIDKAAQLLIDFVKAKENETPVPIELPSPEDLEGRIRPYRSEETAGRLSELLDRLLKDLR